MTNKTVNSLDSKKKKIGQNKYNERSWQSPSSVLQRKKKTTQVTSSALIMKCLTSVTDYALTFLIYGDILDSK